MPIFLISFCLLSLLLFCVWMIFSGQFTPLLLTFGMISSALISLLVLVIGKRGRQRRFWLIRLLLAAPAYYVWLAKEIWVSGVQVSRIIWSGKQQLSPVFDWIDMPLMSSVGKTAYANSITLTPGTVCVDVKGNRGFVHALEGTSLEVLRAGEMARRVSRLEHSG